MVALPLPRMLAGGLASVRRWEIWSLREPLRSYLVAVPVIVFVITAWAAFRTGWQASQIPVFLALIGCGVIAIEATRTLREVHGAVSRDLQTVWYLAVAVALPPVYALLAPILLTLHKLWRMPRMIVYRRVFSNATISLAYGAGSLFFHSIPGAVAGPVPGRGLHVLSWTACVAAAGLAAWLVNHGLLLVALKASDPSVRVAELFGTRESVTADLVELSLAVLVSLLVAINPALMALALPSVVFYRRYLMQAQLVAQARLDAKTGLLNAATWQREAEAELIRAVRHRTPLALVMMDIDHFSSVNDTAGRAAGDEVLRGVARVLTEHLHGSGLAGRVGGEEFAILLPETAEEEARRIGERIRDHIAAEPIAIENGGHAGFVFRLTVSIGIAVLGHSRGILAELMGAADGALSEAKHAGRNRVCVVPGTDGTG